MSYSQIHATTKPPQHLYTVGSHVHCILLREAMQNQQAIRQTAKPKNSTSAITFHLFKWKSREYRYSYQLHAQIIVDGTPSGLPTASTERLEFDQWKLHTLSSTLARWRVCHNTGQAKFAIKRQATNNWSHHDRSTIE